MIAIPTTAAAVLCNVWLPAMEQLPSKMSSPKAELMGLAIGGQETGYRTRVQYGNGPAHSFWQFEEGGIKGVMRALPDLARAVCAHYGVPFDAHAIWQAMVTNDELGACFTRLNLWASPKPLPAIGQQDAAWDYYVGIWRPGKPDKDRWPAAYAEAIAALQP